MGSMYLAHKENKSDWYEQIEEPIRGLVKLLRDSGFNTTCSCGHLPNPYIEMAWLDDAEPRKLYNLLVENGYRGFIITAHWSSDLTPKHICLRFYPKGQLAKESDLRG